MAEKDSGMTLKTLDQFNAERRRAHDAAYERMYGPRPNGIACPHCSGEMFDTNPNVTLTSSPPQKNVHCQCGYTGYRIA